MLKEKRLHISNTDSRQRIRERVVREFLKEEPGSGTGKLASRYKYYVETLKDGKSIILTRPARFNKGFDFVVRVENINFDDQGVRSRNNPRHLDIIEDLANKRIENPRLYRKLFGLIQQIHACKKFTRKDFERLNFKTGYTTDLVLLVIKWFFIEQDITYWSYSGRNMFMRSIPLPE